MVFESRLSEAAAYARRLHGAELHEKGRQSRRDAGRHCSTRGWRDLDELFPAKQTPEIWPSVSESGTRVHLFSCASRTGSVVVDAFAELLRLNSTRGTPLGGHFEDRGNVVRPCSSGVEDLLRTFRRVAQRGTENGVVSTHRLFRLGQHAARDAFPGTYQDTI